MEIETILLVIEILPGWYHKFQGETMSPLPVEPQLDGHSNGRQPFSPNQTTPLNLMFFSVVISILQLKVLFTLEIRFLTQWNLTLTVKPIWKIGLTKEVLLNLNFFDRNKSITDQINKLKKMEMHSSLWGVSHLSQAKLLYLDHVADHNYVAFIDSVTK